MTTFEEMYRHILTKYSREPQFREFLQGLAQDQGMSVEHLAIVLAKEATEDKTKADSPAGKGT